MSLPDSGFGTAFRLFIQSPQFFFEIKIGGKKSPPKILAQKNWGHFGDGFLKLPWMPLPLFPTFILPISVQKIPPSFALP
jgi:hypothetical protein